MSIPLSEAIEQAQSAFDSGDYRSVVDSCSRIVDQYPHYAAAHRLLGQAYLEQGRSREAEASFAQVLTRDPREASAYLGLGLIAEERGVLEHALAYCQVAWELAPNQTYFRDPVTRVAEKRFGGEGHLRLTHAALAQIHAGAWRLRRAAREYQTALSALPDRVDLWIGLAETLWQLGDNTDAAEISREFLKEQPELLQALVILADVEYRSGNLEEAGRYLERLRAVDPDGRRAQAMVETNPLASAAFFAISDEQVPTLADHGDVVVNERPMIAPAPDFTYQPDEEVQVPELDIDELEPIALEEFEDQLADEPVAALIDDPVAEPPVEEEAGAEPEQDAFEVLEAELHEIEPTQPEAMAQEPEPEDVVLQEALEERAPAAEPLAPEGDEQDLIAALETAEDGLDDLLAEFEGIEPMSFEEFGAIEGLTVEQGSGFFDGAEIDFDMRIDDPDAVQIGGGPPPATSRGAFAATGSGFGGSAEFPEFPDVEEAEQPAEDTVADAQTEILDAVDELVAEAGPEAAEPPADIDLEAELLEDAVSGEQPAIEAPSGTGYTTLIGELGSAGLSPFDPSRTALDDAGELPSMEAPEPGERDEVALVDDWDAVDEELDAAIPTEIASTDELLALERLDLQPFTPEEDEIDQIVSVDAGEHASAEVKAVPEVSEPEPVSEPPAAVEDYEPAEEVALASTGFTDILGGIEPFAIEEFDDLVDDEPFSFGRLPWEQQGDSSALPSDEDLEAMLGEETAEGRGVAPSADTRSEPAPESYAPAPPPAFGDPVEDFDFSTAVTRELGGGTIDPDFERRMAEVEAAATRNLEAAQQDEDHRAAGEPSGAPDSEAHAQPEAAGDGSRLLRPDTNLLRPGTSFMRRLEPDNLVANEGLFQRSRAAKDEMVAEGIIRGDREISSNGEAAPAPPASMASQGGTGFTRSVETLRAALQVDPDDEEMRWWLAEALRERGEIHAALTEYRWLIRQAPARHGAVIEALNACIDAGIEPELAHRLLADTYRRHGDSAQARHHASLAMAVRRQTRRLHV